MSTLSLLGVMWRGQAMEQVKMQAVNNNYKQYCIRQNFHWTKFRQAQLPLYCRNIRNFRQCGEGHHILNVIINTGQKNSSDKNFANKADGEIRENFLLVKIFAYTLIEANLMNGFLCDVQKYLCG